VGIRETINEKPGIAAGITAALILLVAVFAYYTMSGGGSAGGGGTVPMQAFYSDDDGKTYFADDEAKVAPFDRGGGKVAVRARVYKCGGKTFVNHLERYTAEAKKRLEASRGASDSAINIEASAGLEVKSPGAGEWVRMSDPRAAKIVQPKCPDGGSDLEIVTP
jgi:hypothetical protein